MPVANIAYRVRFSSSEDGAPVRRVEGAQAAETGDGGHAVVEGAPVSTRPVARVAVDEDYRFFAGWRSDPFFCDVEGAKNNLQFTGEDFFADKDVCSIVLEVPNSELGREKVGLWARTLDDVGDRWVQADRGARPQQAVFLTGAENAAYLAGEPATMPVSLPSSRTPWSTGMAIRQRKQSGWPRHCCRTSSPMIPSARRPPEQWPDTHRRRPRRLPSYPHKWEGYGR
jgi:hypothetical protein